MWGTWGGEGASGGHEDIAGDVGWGGGGHSEGRGVGGGV